MPGAFGQNGGSIKLVNDAYVLGLGRGPYAKPSGQRPDSARPAVRPWPTGPSPGIKTCLVPGSPFPPIQTVTSKLSLSTVTRYNINALYLGDLKTHRGQGSSPCQPRRRRIRWSKKTGSVPNAAASTSCVTTRAVSLSATPAAL